MQVLSRTRFTVFLFNYGDIMGRQRIWINPICGERVKELCKLERISQRTLSEKLFISEQTISKITNGKASLTVNNAILIHKLFPSYRTEWLLGFDDYRTEYDAQLMPVVLDGIRRKAISSGIETIGKELGFSINRLVDDISNETETINPEKLNLCLEISKGYSTVKVSFQYYNDFCDDLAGYIEYKFTRLLNKHSGDSIGNTTVADYQREK